MKQTLAERAQPLPAIAQAVIVVALLFLLLGWAVACAVDWWKS